jgi:hypothetical protein
VLHAYRGVNGLRRCSSRVARCLKPKLLSQLVRGGTVGLSPCIVAVRWHIFGLHQRTLRTPMREVRRPYHLLGPQQGSPHLRQDPLGRMPRRLCRRPGQGPTGLRSFRYHAWRGNPSGEEVRDGPHSDNRCGGNRGGVAPTAAPLSPQAGPGS